MGKSSIVFNSGLAVCEEVELALREWEEQAASKVVAADPQLAVQGERLPEWISRMRAAIAKTQAKA
jgi:hypothetical protein